jgi:REP element-mobilizing transposase RayT
MPFDPIRPRRRSLRLKGYDYSRAGAYFITICAQDRACVFGRIDNQEIIYSPAGLMVLSVWESIPTKFPSVELDAFIIMPNHVHFIIILVGAAPRGRPDLGQARGPAPTVPDVVGWFKSLTTAKYRHSVRDHDWPRFRKRLWQRNYWEHIIRNEKSLNRLRRYIENNPFTWESDDQLHPNRPTKW